MQECPHSRGVLEGKRTCPSALFVTAIPRIATDEPAPVSAADSAGSAMLFSIAVAIQPARAMVALTTTSTASVPNNNSETAWLKRDIVPLLHDPHGRVAWQSTSEGEHS